MKVKIKELMNRIPTFSKSEIVQLRIGFRLGRKTTGHIPELWLPVLKAEVRELIYAVCEKRSASAQGKLCSE